MSGDKIAQEIDRVYAQEQSSFRRHLGASVLGRGCSREIWYGFRWIKDIKHSGRLLRLFSRGKDEEARIISWLRSIGAVVEEADPETGEQFHISDFAGHFGGSGDGRIRNLDRFGLPGTGVLEIKTHGDKSFTKLKQTVNGKEAGVRVAKPEHYTQMQIYMHGMQLPWGLYVAVNKNNDALHVEVVEYEPHLGEKHWDLARAIIRTHAPPPKINESPAWFQCRMCAYKEICHYDAVDQVARNCRSCAYASPDTENGGWHCAKYRGAIPENFVYKGCPQWEKIST